MNVALYGTHCTSSGKRRLKHQSWHKTLSASAIKVNNMFQHVSTCCITFSTWANLSNFEQSEHKNWTKSVTIMRKIKSNSTSLPVTAGWISLPRSLRGQFKIKILIVWHINTTYFIWTHGCSVARCTVTWLPNFLGGVDKNYSPKWRWLVVIFAAR